MNSIDFKVFILVLITLFSCNQLNKTKKDEIVEVEECTYKNHFSDLGNSKIDTITINNRTLDPIDDFMNFKETDFGFFKRYNRIYKKAKTHRRCGDKLIGVEYFQDFTNRIELSSYEEYDGRFFRNKDNVNFWWVNSGGFFIVPVQGADPNTFKPFEDICGGTDANGVYYGSPNFGVHKLNIPKKSKYKFIAKEDNYWNSPSHYIIIDNNVYNVNYKFDRGYYCELDKTTSLSDLVQ